VRTAPAMLTSPSNSAQLKNSSQIVQGIPRHTTVATPKDTPARPRITSDHSFSRGSTMILSCPRRRTSQLWSSTRDTTGRRTQISVPRLQTIPRCDRRRQAVRVVSKSRMHGSIVRFKGES
jgi:hypothetical protein